mgnify:CR=1 FL=1
MVLTDGVGMVATLVNNIRRAWLGLAMLSLISCTETIQQSDQPVIVLASIDTLRADHLSSYGYHRQTSPFIDSLASKGVRFDKARSASPWTLPAHVTMLTGQLPATHKVVDDGVSLAESTPVLPEILQEKGWATGGVVSTMYVSSLFGFQRGFDFFEDFSLLNEKKNLSGSVDAEDIIDKAISFIKGQAATEPIFLFLHFYDVHYAYDAPSPFDEKFDRPSRKGDQKYKTYFYFKNKKKVKKAQREHQIAQYDEEIVYVDSQLQRFHEELSKHRSNITWIVTADHGEEFWERGSWGHAHTLYSEQLHIPLIVSGDDIPTLVQSSGWVGNHDIAPTIESLAGVKGLKADGIDLSPYLNEEAKLPERSFLGETTRFTSNRLSLLQGQYRLEWDLKTDRYELFNVDEDPKEKNNIAAEKPEIAVQLKMNLEEELGAPWTALEDGIIWLDRSYALKKGRKERKLFVEKGESFQILPYDAAVYFSGTEQNGEKLGPWQQVGATNPSEERWLHVESSSGNEVELDDKAKKMLEQLGYIQESAD